MMTYLIVFVFITLAFIFMAVMLHFSKYKQRESGCCADSIETTDYNEDSCFTCPNKEDENCISDQMGKLKIAEEG